MTYKKASRYFQLWATGFFICAFIACFCAETGRLFYEGAYVVAAWIVWNFAYKLVKLREDIEKRSFGGRQ
jgi:hypothetical protein